MAFFEPSYLFFCALCSRFDMPGGGGAPSMPSVVALGVDVPCPGRSDGPGTEEPGKADCDDAVGGTEDNTDEGGPAPGVGNGGSTFLPLPGPHLWNHLSQQSYAALLSVGMRTAKVLKQSAINAQLYG